MFLQDLPYIFFWWSIIFLLGAIFFPLTNRLFASFIDRGYIFSKILGILVFSYLVWVLGILRILPFTQNSLYLLMGILIVIDAVFLFGSLRGDLLSGSTRQSSHHKKDSHGPLRGPRNDNNRKVLFLILFEELLFFACLVFWSFVKGHQPDIQGLEKFMDFGFINSILRTKFFPPLDMWLAPSTVEGLSQSPSYANGGLINYYYFGHLVTAVLTKLTSINPAITFNLMLATVFSFTFTGAFSIGINLISHPNSSTSGESFGHPRGVFIAGLLTAFLVTLAGNLHTIYAFLKPYIPADKPVPFWQLPLQFNFSSYWYPNATRFIPYTIHEFPSYSFVVSDLHGHVLDIPFVLLTIALLLKIAKDGLITKLKLVLLGFLLAVMYMTNAWDGIIYFGLSGLVFLYIFYLKNKNLKNKKNLTECLFSLTKYVTSLFLLFVIFSIPFQLHFKPFVFGIGIVRDHSPLWMLAILWGFFYYCVAGFIFVIKQRKPSEIFILLMIILSTGLLIFPELFYIKDIYPLHYRANTMFKLGYQAFIMLSLASGYIIALSLRGVKRRSNLFQELRLPRPSTTLGARNGLLSQILLRKTKIKKILTTLYKILLLLLLFLVMIYPYFSINSYFGNLKTYKGLYGLSYLEKLYPNDYKAILWLKANVGNQPTILEAVGDSYTDYARVSANTGLPTVLGWPVHEWLWRGSYDEAGKRVEEVKNFYSTPGVEQARNFIKKYQVKYVFIGQLEKQKYAGLNEEKFAKLGKIVYQSGETKIFEIND